MSRELRICPGVGNRKCSAFLSSLDRDPHPTCPRCRGKICTRDLTCDFCIDWSPAQWELFAKKRAYKDRKKSRPSGSVPPAPRAGTSSEVPQPGISSSSSSRPSGGQDERGGSQGAPGVVSCEASSPPARPRSSERGGSVSGHSSVASECASVSAAPSGAGEGRLLGRSGLPLPAPLPRLLLPAHHSTLGDVMSREKFRWTAPFLDPPVFPDLRIEEQRRIVELALGRTAFVTVAVVLALAPLTVHGQEVESVGGGHPLGRCPLASGRDLRIAPGACALALGETGLDPWIDTGLAGTTLGMTGRGLLTATGHVDSVRVPPLAGELSLVVLMTALGLVDDTLPPLTVRGQRREDGKPDVSSKRVWRR